MAINKELALALDFKNAPLELQKAAELHYADQKALAKSKRQVELWQMQLIEHERKMHETAKPFKKLLDSWDPIAPILDTKLEVLPEPKK